MQGHMILRLAGENTSFHKKEGVQEISRRTKREDQNKVKTVILGAFKLEPARDLWTQEQQKRGFSKLVGQKQQLDWQEWSKWELGSNQLVHGEVSFIMEARPHTGSLMLAPEAEGALDVTS